jgi:hypothetical protein
LDENRITKPTSSLTSVIVFPSPLDRKRGETQVLQAPNDKSDISQNTPPSTLHFYNKKQKTNATSTCENKAEMSLENLFRSTFKKKGKATHVGTKMLHVMKIIRFEVSIFEG